jgi:hypothetical protein
VVAFATTATNLPDHRSGPAATAGAMEVWLRDITASTTYLVSRADGLTGPPATPDSGDPSIAITDRGKVPRRKRCTRLINSGRSRTTPSLAPTGSHPPARSADRRSRSGPLA